MKRFETLMKMFLSDKLNNTRLDVVILVVLASEDEE